MHTDDVQDSLARMRLSARKLFVERGYHDTRPQDVAYGAGVGHGTFYLHYRNKRDCFLDFIEGAHAEFHIFLRDHVRYPATMGETIDHTMRAMLEFSDQNPGLLGTLTADVDFLNARHMRRPSALKRWGYVWAQMIQHGIQDNTVPADYEPKIVGQVIVAAITLCLEEKELGFSREVIITNLTQFVTRALAVPPVPTLYCKTN